jgi:hypothetical protein
MKYNHKTTSYKVAALQREFSAMPENDGVDFDTWVRDQISMTSEEYDIYLAYKPDVDVIVEHFLIAAIWADCPEGTSPRATKQAKEWAKAFVERFIAAYPYKVARALAMPWYGSHPDAGSPEAAFGHDLYLTCAGHGVGFQDRTELQEWGGMLHEEIRQAWREWHVEAQFSRGWLYF